MHTDHSHNSDPVSSLRKHCGLLGWVAVALSCGNSHGGMEAVALHLQPRGQPQMIQARKLVLCLRIKRDADIGKAHLLFFEMASHYVALVVL